jgi:hypothetical protein
VGALREAIRLEPELHEAYTLLGVSLIDVAVGAGEDVDATPYQEAIAAFPETIRLNPVEPRPYGHLGEVLNIVERHAEALATPEHPDQMDRANARSARLSCWTGTGV